MMSAWVHATPSHDLDSCRPYSGMESEMIHTPHASSSLFYEIIEEWRELKLRVRTTPLTFLINMFSFILLLLHFVNLFAVI